MFIKYVMLMATNKFHHSFSCRVRIQIDVSRHFFCSGDIEHQESASTKMMSSIDSHENHVVSIFQNNTFTLEKMLYK